MITVFRRLLAGLVLLLSFSMLPLVRAEPRGQERIPISYGQTVTGEIDNLRFFQQYSFEGRAGDRVVITMEGSGGNLDPLLLLGDSGLNLIAEDDDGAGGFDARIEAVLPADGVYIVEATRYGQDTEAGQSTGAFRLTLVANQAQAQTAAQPAGVLAGLEFGDTERGLLTPADSFHLFWFQAQAGDRIRIRGGYGSGSSATLVLYDSATMELARDVSGREIQTVLNEGGVYWVGLGLNDPSQESTYALTLTGNITDPLTGEADAFLMTYNESVEGSIADDRVEERYVFQGQANDQVLVTMVALDSGLDSFLYLYGPNGEIVGQDDDGGGAPDAQLAAVLPVDGLYTIVATRFGRDNGPSSGDYALTIASSNEAAAGVFALGEPLVLPEAFGELPQIAYGDVLGGSVSNEAYSQAYVFEAREGDRIQITVENVGGNLDPMVMLLDGALNTIAQHDDISDINKNARLEFTIPADGYYGVLAMRFNGEVGTTSGDYRLSLIAENRVQFSQVATLLSPEVLAVGETSGQLGDALAEVYQMYAVRGDVLTLDLLVNGPLQDEAILILADANLQEVAVSFDGTLRYEVPQTGAYLLLVTRQGGPLGTARGFYDVSLYGAAADAAEQIGVQAGIAFAPGDVVPYGTLLLGELSDAVPELRYLFLGQAGDRISVRMDALDDTLDPFVQVLGQDGQEVVRDDDTGGNLNALIPGYLLTETGEYTLVAGRSGGNQGSSRGRFELLLGGVPVAQPGEEADGDGLAPQTALSLEIGQTVAGSLSNERVAIFYGIQLRADTAIQVDMVRVGGDLDSYLVILDGTEALVAVDDDSGGSQNARLLYSVPEDGLYYVGATRFEFMDGQTAGDFLLSVVER